MQADECSDKIEELQTQLDERLLLLRRLVN
jgi:hypothetical protein